MKVMHVVISLDVGGLERVVLELLRRGRALGQDISVLCLERPGALADEAKSIGAEVYCVEKKPGLKFSTVGRIARVLKQVQPDVIHTHQVGALFYAGPATRFCGSPRPVVVHTEHGKHYLARKRTAWLGKVSAKFCDRFCCVSKDIAAEVAACRVAPARKIDVIYNGIDIEKFATAAAEGAKVRADLGIAPTTPVIGTIGRLSEIKRQDVLLRGFARVIVSVPEARLMLVGDGPEMESLKKLAGELTIQDRVHFAGYQSKPHAYLSAMNVFALTSRSEGMPLVILEAWAAGVPVVASSVGGLVEMLDGEKFGLMFPSGNDEALAAALKRLLTDAGVAKRLADVSRQHAEERFTTRRMTADYQRHYVEQLATQPARAQELEEGLATNR